MNILYAICGLSVISALILFAYGLGRRHERKRYGIPKENVYDFYTGRKAK